MPSSLRRQALRIFRAARESRRARRSGVASFQAARRHADSPAARRYRLNEFSNIYVIGAGKAGAQNGAGRGTACSAEGLPPDW